MIGGTRLRPAIAWARTYLRRLLGMIDQRRHTVACVRVDCNQRPAQFFTKIVKINGFGTAATLGSVSRPTLRRPARQRRNRRCDPAAGDWSRSFPLERRRAPAQQHVSSQFQTTRLAFRFDHDVGAAPAYFDHLARRTNRVKLRCTLF